MFRINHLLRLKNVSVKLLQRYPIERATCFGFQRVQVTQAIRFYSKDKDDSDKKRLPHINEEECPPKASIEDECPQAKKDPPGVCPEEGGGGWDNYKNALLVGLLIAAATLATLYAPFLKKKDKDQDSKKTKKKRVPIKDPPSSQHIPDNVPYLLIGGGTASFSAFRAIKSADPTAKVLVITNESFHPYMRPPLSKEIWFNEDKDSVQKLIFKQWNGTERNLFYEPEDFYIGCRQLMHNPNGGVAVARGYTVSHIDIVNRTAYLDDGYSIQYDKCLIATGAKPKTLSVFAAACSDPKIEEKVKTYRNIFDFEDVYYAFEDSKTVAIIGGGFLGSELACALARKGKKSRKTVYQIFREKGNMGKILPEYLSNWTTNKVKSEGVTVLPETEVTGVKFENERLSLILKDGKLVSADAAVLAVGVEPNTQMAEQSGLEVDPDLGGYLVNTELMARSHLYIAGDCACFYDVKLGRRRVEHHDHAVVTGRLAGENMAGGMNPYVHQSMFWSDLGPDVGYEAIGIVDASLPTVGVFARASEKDTPKAVVSETGEGIRSKTEAVERVEENTVDTEKKEGKSQDYGKGVIFYLRDDVVVGIVLWNVFNRMSIARQVLKDERKYDDLNEVAKLFNIHEE